MGAVGPGWKALDLDAIEAVPWRGTELVWRPVRHALGTRIVGLGGYTADRAGQIVIEGHTESEDGMGHEEVYVVLRGRATFTLDGTELDAPAGTFVAVSDPSVHRRAVAAEPGTAVLALGGPPGPGAPPPGPPAGLRAGRLRVDRARAAAPAHRPGARAPHPRRATSREARRSRRRGGGGVQGARARRRVESPRRDPRAPEAPPRPPGRPRRR